MIKSSSITPWLFAAFALSSSFGHAQDPRYEKLISDMKSETLRTRFDAFQEISRLAPMDSAAVPMRRGRCQVEQVVIWSSVSALRCAA